MSYPDFPTLTSKADSSKYSVTTEDPAVRSQLEGGYVSSRPRHTRIPRKKWTIGYSFIDDVDKDALETFVDLVKVGSNIFRWLNPENSIYYYARFNGAPSYKYRGAGNTRRWDVDFQLEEA